MPPNIGSNVAVNGSTEEQEIDLPVQGIDLGNWGAKSDQELVEGAYSLGITNIPSKRGELVIKLLLETAKKTKTSIGIGLLDILNDGYGFIRPVAASDVSEDIYVARNLISQYKLRKSDFIAGPVMAPKQSGHYSSLIFPEVVGDKDAKSIFYRPAFDTLTPIYPNQQITLTTSARNLSTRIIDMIAPIGKGQRALIVAPPKAGKTVILKDIAAAIAKNYPDIYIIVALIGERPEEVTDMRRSIVGECYASTFDEPAEDHCKTAKIALERAKRITESDQHVVLLLDSLTRLARAYNVTSPSSGKTMSGGMDPVALYPPKMFFGAARNSEEGGSLTIIATALIDTGSRLDDLIYEEFKGTGNMELHLNRRMADRRIFPAIDVEKSGTRHEELLLNAETLKQVWLLRRMIALIGQNSSDTGDSAERILEYLRKTNSNRAFLESIGQREKV